MFVIELTPSHISCLMVCLNVVNNGLCVEGVALLGVMFKVHLPCLDRQEPTLLKS